MMICYGAVPNEKYIYIYISSIACLQVNLILNIKIVRCVKKYRSDGICIININNLYRILKRIPNLKDMIFTRKIKNVENLQSVPQKRTVLYSIGSWVLEVSIEEGSVT